MVVSRGPKIALIYGLGGVARGENDASPITGEMTMGSDTTAAAIKKASDDPSIKAIVFRVDSPGGSYVASDVIYHEVMLAKNKKPTREQIVTHMDGNICRCGTYPRIVRAIERAAREG